jgi:hypothetical protein
MKKLKNQLNIRKKIKKLMMKNRKNKEDINLINRKIKQKPIIIWF